MFPCLLWQNSLWLPSQPLKLHTPQSQKVVMMHFSNLWEYHQVQFSPDPKLCPVLSCSTHGLLLCFDADFFSSECNFWQSFSFWGVAYSLWSTALEIPTIISKQVSTAATNAPRPSYSHFWQGQELHLHQPHVLVVHQKYHFSLTSPGNWLKKSETKN